MSSPVSCSRAAQRSADLGERVLESPFGLDLLEQRDGGRFDAVGLQRVDVVALLHRAHAAHARVLVGEAAHHVVQQALAHRALGDAHAARCPRLSTISSRIASPAGKHRRALRVDVRQLQLVDVAGGEHPLGELLQILGRDSRRVGIKARARTSPMTRTVPELPKACSQPSLR